MNRDRKSAAYLIAFALLVAFFLVACGPSPTEPHALVLGPGKVIAPTRTPTHSPTPTPCIVSPWTDCGGPSGWPTPTPGIVPTSTPPAWVPTRPAGQPTPTYAPWPTGVPTPPPQDGP